MNRLLSAGLLLLALLAPACATDIRSSIVAGQGAAPALGPSEIGINRTDGLLWYRNAANTANVPGVLPSNAAAVAYTPTVTPGSGSFGTGVTATGRYLTIGKLVYVYVKLTIPQNNAGTGAGNGTAAGFISISLPAAPATDAALIGQETTATGSPTFGQILGSTGLVYLKRMDGTTTGLFNGNVNATLSGVYERQ